VALCNNYHDVVEGEYHLYKEWQLSFLGHPTYIRIRNGAKGCGEDERSNEANWAGGNKSNGGCKYFLEYHQWILYSKWLLFCPDEAARYRQLYSLPYVKLWLVRNICSFIILIWWQPQGSW
jgi:hypothetical protein